MITEETQTKYWTEERLEEAIKKLPDTIELYWDYRDEVSDDDIAKVLKHGQEAIYEVEDELTDLNTDEFFRLADEAVDEALEAMRKKSEVSEEEEERFKEMVQESDRLGWDVNMKDLIRGSSDARCIVVVTGDEDWSYEAYRGVKTTNQVDEICATMKLLNVNPKFLQKWVTADNEDRPSYDPEPVVFPDHPERDGQEYVKLSDVEDIMNETEYGGLLTFMVTVPVQFIFDNIESIINGSITVHKGTLCFPYCRINGAGPCADMTLTKDLVLEKGTFKVWLDSEVHYGVQDCYGFTEKPWKAGSISIKEAVDADKTN